MESVPALLQSRLACVGERWGVIDYSCDPVLLTCDPVSGAEEEAWGPGGGAWPALALTPPVLASQRGDGHEDGTAAAAAGAAGPRGPEEPEEASGGGGGGGGGVHLSPPPSAAAARRPAAPPAPPLHRHRRLLRSHFLSRPQSLPEPARQREEESDQEHGQGQRSQPPGPGRQSGRPPVHAAASRGRWTTGPDPGSR